ncbi:MAG: rRNA methyltransferase, partial [Clostridiales bacterium]|nr:rRNA methyltransferase [Clostridiales bacterium]
MEFPVALTNAIQQLAARYPMAQLKNAAEEISRRYRQETGRGKTLLRGELEAAAYALARMPATLGAVAAALEYTLEEATDFAPKTLLDVGAGTGAACWAAEALLPLEQVTCLEREAAMRQLGQELMGEGSEVLQEVEWLAA